MKLSLVIPTRERARFLRESIATATACRDPDIEILISDNASTDDTQAVINGFADPRIKAVQTGRRVSMRQNFENAIEESSGDYIIMIGDDDGFLAGQIPILRRILADRQPDVLSWKIPTFGWPVAPGGNAGVRFIKSGCYGKPVAADLGALKHAKSTANSLGLTRQPVLYHGCVSRTYLQSLRGNSGAIIAGKIPDVYFTQAAIIRGGNFQHTGHPFTINGYSFASTGGATHAYSSEDPRARPAMRFAQEAEADPVQDVIPEFTKSIPFIHFATLETARREMNAAAFPVDYFCWYRHVLGHLASLDDGTRDQLRSLLADYAYKTDTADDHSRAQLAGSKVGEKVGGLFGRMSRLASFKPSARRGGKATILTAAELMGDILADDYDLVLDGSLSSAGAWLRALRRGLKYRIFG